MNLLLIDPTDINNNQAVICETKSWHILNILKLQQGDNIRVGIINGKIGTGKILSTASGRVTIEIDCSIKAPRHPEIQLILAMPRPKVLRRILKGISSTGIKSIYLINCLKVEKSYWQTPLLAQENVNKALISGLEQSVDTILPKIHLRRLFKPFVEDELSGIAQSTEKLIAHPNAKNPCPVSKKNSMTIVIGPEGGFSEYEVTKFEEIDFNDINSVISHDIRENNKDYQNALKIYNAKLKEYEILKEEKRVKASFETNRGCPFKCAFCDWGGQARSKVTKFNMDPVYEQLDFLYNHTNIAEVEILDANFGMLPRDLDVVKNQGIKTAKSAVKDTIKTGIKSSIGLKQ